MKLQLLFPLALLLPLLASLPAAAQETHDELAARFEARVQKDKDGHTLPYRLLRPEPYEPGKKYPLVIFFHGAGERGTDNLAQLVHGVTVFATTENRKKYPCFVMAPQCPADKRWVEMDWSAPSGVQPAEPSDPMRLAIAAADALEKEFSIDRRREYVTGLSMGGFGTWDAITRYPKRFAAAAPVCGGGDEAVAARAKKIPVWAFHGSADNVVMPDRSRHMVEALRKAGAEPKYTEYPGVGHNSWDKAYADPELLSWLFSQHQ